MALKDKMENTLLFSRWLLMPILLGALIVLIIFEITFFISLYEAIFPLSELKKKSIILLTLDSIDMVLIAGLIVMVIINTYEQFISPIEENSSKNKPGWIGALDGSQLKLKILGTLLLISSIHLLHLIFEDNTDNNQELFEGAIVQGIFILTAVIMLFMAKNKNSSH